MAAITVGEVRDALPPGTGLLGGAAGLGRPVTGTTAFRARMPAFPALHGGEIALVPLPLLRQVDPNPQLDRLVAQLAEAGIAALVLLGAEHSQAAAGGSGPLASAASAAEAHVLPVFAVPPGPTSEEVDLALHRHLAGQRETLLRRSQELQQEFTQLALAGRGLGAIVERLAAVTGLAAAWETPPALEPVAWTPPPAGWMPPPELSRSGAAPDALLKAARLPLQRWIASLPADGRADIATLPLRADAAGASSPWRRLVTAVRGEGEGVAGYLSLIGADHGSEARLALAAAGLAASIEVLRARTAWQAQGSAVAALIHDWLAGRPGPGEIAARAEQLGLALAPPFAIVVVESEHPLGEDDLAAFAPAVGAASSGPYEPVGPRRDLPVSTPLLSTGLGDGRTALIVPVAAESALDSAAPRLHAALTGRAAAGGAAGSVFAGIGRAAGRADDVPRAYGEALQALAVARRLGGRHRVAYFGTLGVYRVLAATAPDELAGFRREALGPLLQADDRADGARRSGAGAGDLLRTLETYLLCGGSPQETAQRLHTHRNTVLYRLQKIGEALGVDVRAPEAQFTLWLALRAGDVLGDVRAPSDPRPRTTSPAPSPRPPSANGAAHSAAPASAARAVA